MKNLSKRLLLTLFLSASTLATSSAQASAGHFNDTLYFGAGISNTRLEINQPSIRAAGSLSPESSLQNNQSGLSVFAGARLDDYLSIELGFIDFGSYSTQTNNQKAELFSADSLYLTGSFNYPLNHSFNSYVKVGFSEWAMESKNTTLQADGTGIVYGAGIDINLYGSSSRTLKIEWLHQTFDDVFLTDSDSVSASIVFSF